MNAARLNMSGKRMCIPPMDEKLFLAAVRAVVDVDREWVPYDAGTSLYIRPFIIATGEYLGLKISPSYKFIIILSPVASYYKNGLRPTSVYIESEMSRSVAGGTGAAKCIGNYAPTLLAEDTAHKNGYDQVMWLDGAEHKYIEEIGTANAFFVLKDEVWTASLNQGTILPGVTRASVIRLLEDRGFHVKEIRIPVEELFAAYRDGQLTEAFATGTASVISPVGELVWKDHTIKFTENMIGSVTKDMYDTLTGIQYGKLEDKYGWVMEV
jgi:branched-chain amino acid aminotransferase